MNKNSAILSIHDITPAHESLINDIIEMLCCLKYPPPALLVVPDFHRSWSLEKYPEFCEFIKKLSSKGCEIILHGFTHLSQNNNVNVQMTLLNRLKSKYLTAGESEFMGINEQIASEKIHNGLQVFEKNIGIKPNGFIAPSWLFEKYLPEMLRNYGFQFTEDHLNLYCLNSFKKEISPTVTFASRSLGRIVGSIAWSKIVLPVSYIDNLRFAIHPLDFTSKVLKRNIESSLKYLKDIKF